MIKEHNSGIRTNYKENLKIIVKINIKNFKKNFTFIIVLYKEMYVVKRSKYLVVKTNAKSTNDLPESPETDFVFHILNSKIIIANK